MYSFQLITFVVAVSCCFLNPQRHHYSAVQAIQLKTSATLTGVSSTSLQDFLARPIHWPEIVASSNRVDVVDNNSSRSKSSRGSRSSSDSKDWDPSLPLRPGSSVQEYFGLNLLSVDWTCTENKPGRLIVKSPKGLVGIADSCVMDFSIKEATGTISQTTVVLTMEYNPLSPVALLATPALVADNWIALNVLLPAAIKKKLGTSS